MTHYRTGHVQFYSKSASPKSAEANLRALRDFAGPWPAHLGYDALSEYRTGIGKALT